jgi:hypothetical protein
MVYNTLVLFVNKSSKKFISIQYFSLYFQSGPKQQTRRASGKQIKRERIEHYYKQKQKPITGKQKLHQKEKLA